MKRTVADRIEIQHLIADSDKASVEVDSTGGQARAKLKFYFNPLENCDEVVKRSIQIAQDAVKAFESAGLVVKK